MEKDERVLVSKYPKRSDLGQAGCPSSFVGLQPPTSAIVQGGRANDRSGTYQQLGNLGRQLTNLLAGVLNNLLS